MRAALGRSRQIVLDVVEHARSVPTFPVERTLHLAELSELRTAVQPRVSWTVLFAKAWAIVAADMPVWRTIYVAAPWPHTYRAPHSVATIAMHRRWAGEDWLFWPRLVAPENRELSDLQAELDRFRSAPVEVVFRRHLLASRVPRWLRRPFWWWRLYGRVSQRPRRVGTFGISTLGGQGSYNRHHPHFLTSSLSFGPLTRDGEMLVTLLSDHRLVDGLPAAQGLQTLEQVLQHEISTELRRDASYLRAA